MPSTYIISFNYYLGDDESKIVEVTWLGKWQNLWVQVKAILGLTTEPKDYAINLYSLLPSVLKILLCGDLMNMQLG